MSSFPQRSNYDVERLRKIAGIHDEDIDEITNYQCQECGYYQYVDDHHRHTPNWCESCEEVQSFAKLEAMEP